MPIGCLFRNFLGHLYGVLMMFNNHRIRTKLIENSTNLHMCGGSIVHELKLYILI